MPETGIVNIKGKDYKTVALRVSEFREQYTAKEGWFIRTEILERTDKDVVVRACVGFKADILAVGHAEEQRASSQVNRTSALENAETSAIGRALAAFGLGGSQYASADEVANAIHQQQSSGRRETTPRNGVTKETKNQHAYFNIMKEWTGISELTDVGAACRDFARRLKIVPDGNGKLSAKNCGLLASAVKQHIQDQTDFAEFMADGANNGG